MNFFLPPTTIYYLLSTILAAVLGACLGSFANVLAIRLHESSSLLGRSKCPACDKPIRPRHLVPLFSWLALRGKCADCGAVIHVQYPLVEFACAILTVIAAIRHSPFGPDAPLFIIEALFAIILVVIVVMDLRWQEFPLELIIAVGVIAFTFRVLALWLNAHPFPDYFSYIAAGALTGFLFFGFQWALSRGRWLGSGDVWFGVMMGLVLGTWQQTGIAIYLAYLVGGTVVIVLYLLKKVRRGMRVPFGPALATGLMLALWFGPSIETYVRQFFVV